MFSLLQRHLSASTSSLPKLHPFHAGLCCISSLTVMMLWILQLCSGKATLAETQSASALICVLNVGSPCPESSSVLLGHSTMTEGQLIQLQLQAANETKNLCLCSPSLPFPHVSTSPLYRHAVQEKVCCC